ncbi:hypothetical protein EDC04DRAFT_2897116 [Pisolithus marmoratus]|nr:hypothetical protein EDC04DRAFT_2897116 [Pisolithus marmoratus]
MVTQDLAAARAELARLQNRERELIDELRSVRAAAEVQMDRINVFIKRRSPAPISRLPLSVLSDIIYLTICNTHPESDAHRCTKRELASVSRAWRDAILSCPQLWSNIVVDPAWSVPLVMAHVKRSGACPLDIIITKWTSSVDTSRFQTLLGPTVTCGYRWRSLVIRENHGGSATRILESIQHMMFPAMKRVEISDTSMSNYPPFLTSQYAPALEYMALSKGIFIEEIPNIAHLRVVHLHLTNRTSASLLLLSLLLLPQLSELVLSGTGDEWPDAESIHLPVLTSLTLLMPEPASALAAIVAPSLIYLACSPGELHPRLQRAGGGEHWARVFRDFPNRFTTVRHLCLSDVTRNSSSTPAATAGDAQAVCAACPGVHQAELPADMINFLCVKDNSPADCWQDLKSLTFKGLTVGTIPRKLKRWLITRRSNKMPLLKVTFCEFRMTETPAVSSWPASLYGLLYGYCELELKEVPLKATLNVNSSTSLVDVRGTSKVYDSLGMVKTRYMWCCECFDSART